MVEKSTIHFSSAGFWDFSRHLDRLDAILITRLSDENTSGVGALLDRKTKSAVYPQIGHVFTNLPGGNSFSTIAWCWMTPNRSSKALNIYFVSELLDMG